MKTKRWYPLCAILKLLLINQELKEYQRPETYLSSILALLVFICAAKLFVITLMKYQNNWKPSVLNGTLVTTPALFVEYPDGKLFRVVLSNFCIMNNCRSYPFRFILKLLKTKHVFLSGDVTFFWKVRRLAFAWLAFVSSLPKLYWLVYFDVGTSREASSVNDCDIRFVQL